MAINRNGNAGKYVLLHNGAMLKKGYHNGTTQIWAAGSTVAYNVDGDIYVEEVMFGESVLNPTTFAPAKKGWTFVGWREDTTPSPDVLTEKIMDSDPITLYAVFNQDITLSYSGNGSTGGSTAAQTGKAYYNNGNVAYPTFTLAANGFTKTNYSFTGWDLGAAGAEVELSKDTTAKAQWVGVPYTWVNNFVGSGATLSITVTSAKNVNNLYPVGRVLTEFKVSPDRKDNTDMMSISFETNKVDTRGLKYMTIVFEDFFSSRQDENEDYIEIRSATGTSLLKTYERYYGRTLKVDVSKASSVYIYCRTGAWAYDALPSCRIKSISFSN